MNPSSVSTFLRRELTELRRKADVSRLIHRLVPRNRMRRERRQRIPVLPVPRGANGPGANPPPQFGQTFPSTFSTYVAQNVHSKLQMRASSESGGSGRLQC